MRQFRAFTAAAERAERRQRRVELLNLRAAQYDQTAFRQHLKNFED